MDFKNGQHCSFREEGNRLGGSFFIKELQLVRPFIILFIVFELWGHIRQWLRTFLLLCAKVIPGSTLGIFFGARDQTGVNCVQGKHLNFFISLVHFYIVVLCIGICSGDGYAII